VRLEIDNLLMMIDYLGEDCRALLAMTSKLIID